MLDKQQVLDIINANSLKPRSDIGANTVAHFNERFEQFLKLHPGYDPMATEDYNGPEDSEFLDMLEQVVEEEEGFSLLEEEKKNYLPTFEDFNSH